MPAKSKKQQMAAGAALSAKRGKRSGKSLKGASRGMYKFMSKNQLRDVAKTKDSFINKFLGLCQMRREYGLCD
ncbi:MAG: hypothetical protein A2825_03390 [Candidatus Taylorbacteria bacterium RIFCSPHIGHO2_01_FULL_43_120]|nr:MAG: hypothetical protein A2825_03390 [Candidatus Taylorbacteria bacterium RIFCSPHIGHO2_01_FULL_43_120]